MNILNREEFVKHMDPKNNYLSESESLTEETETTLPELQIEEKAPIGRGRGNNNIPDFLRTTIATLAQDCRGKDIAEAFDVSNAVVSQAKQGRISQSSGIEPKLAAVVKTTQDKIHDEALDKVMQSLNLLGVDDISMLGAKDKADVAMKLSKVASEMRPKNADLMNDNRVQFIIMAPPVRSSVHYDEIEV